MFSGSEMMTQQLEVLASLPEDSCLTLTIYMTVRNPTPSFGVLGNRHKCGAQKKKAYKITKIEKFKDILILVCMKQDKKIIFE